jgi:carbamoyltransferase
MNGRINQMPEVDQTFVIPASSDDGTCLGAALQLYYELGGNPRQHKLEHTYYGPEYSNEKIQKVLDEAKVNYTYEPNIEAYVAEKLAENKIIGWFQGRMEFGARALGNRSILGNPLNKDMKRIINKHVKHREAFRPFCPSMLLEDKDIYLKNSSEAPYMIVAYEIKDSVKDKLPSVVHVDNTVRPQTVNKKYNERYWNLLNEFKKRTGYSVVLNTSFNVMGEPVVCSPVDALRCFYSTGIDYLAIGNFVIEKQESNQIHKNKDEAVYSNAN